MKGHAHVYGDHVDTDVIIPARYLNEPDAQALAAHAMEDIDGAFARRVQPGDVIIAGENFGCGSSREHAPAALKAAGVGCVIAKSFARIFFRNSVNIGLALFVCDVKAEMGDTMRVEWDGQIVNETTGARYQAQPLPEFAQKILQAGGLIEKIRGEQT